MKTPQQEYDDWINATVPNHDQHTSFMEGYERGKSAQQPVTPETGGTKGVGISDLFGDMLKTAMMSPYQEKIVNLGTCPSCMKPLECLGATGGYKWHQCKQCLAVWIMSPNDKSSATATTNAAEAGQNQKDSNAK